MRKYALFLIALTVWGCTTGSLFAKEDEGRITEFSSLEITLSDMSKKITAYYGKQGMTVPQDFNENEFIGVLEKIYPDKEKVEKIKDTYRIKARAINGDYSVVLCDQGTGNKLMEDFSCTLNKVDIRYWDKDTATACEFEPEWQKYCR
jgi:hypothetical protein